MRPFLSRFIHRLLLRQHFWRHLNFSELAELYAVRMLRSVALNMIGVFVAIYLLQNGYSVLFILGYFGLYFLVRALASFVAAYIVAYIGPKHGTLVSNLLFVPSFIFLFLVPDIGLTMIAAYGLTQALANALFNISYNVDFSKVKHIDHVGKELGFMQIMDRVGTALSPLLGGLIALFFGPQVTIIVAMVLFVVSALPLFFSPEPVGTRQRIHLRRVSWQEHRWTFLSRLGEGADFAATSTVWPLFLAVVVFAASSREVYAQIGALASVTIVAALLIAKAYGTLIDKRRGRELLLYSAIGNSGLHMARFLVTTPVGAVAFNVLNEIMTTGYVMPYIKGLYDLADRDDDYRITFLAYSEAVASVGASLMLAIAALCVLFGGEIVGLQLQYVAAALLALLVTTHHFPIYRRRA